MHRKEKKSATSRLAGLTCRRTEFTLLLLSTMRGPIFLMIMTLANSCLSRSVPIPVAYAPYLEARKRVVAPKPDPTSKTC